MKLTPFLTLSLLAASFAAHAADDRPMFGLKGDVQQVLITYAVPEEAGWQTSYDFSPAGELAAVESVPVEIKRDDLGRLSQYIDYEEDEDGEAVKTVITLTYNDQGQVTRTVSVIDEDQWIDTYEYGDDGRLSTHHSEGPDENGDNLILHHTYTYSPDIDEQGNWLSRTETSADPEDPIVTQTRTISYRK